MSDVSWLYCYPKGGDPVDDQVRVILDPGGIRDTYFGVLIREDFEAEVLAVIADLTLPMKVYYASDDFFDEIFDDTKTYADFKQWEIDRGESEEFDIIVVVAMDGTDKSEKEDYAGQIFDRLGKSDFHGWVDVCFFPSEAFEKVPRRLKGFNELAKQYRDEYALFSERINWYHYVRRLNHAEGVKYCKEWRNIQISQHFYPWIDGLRSDDHEHIQEMAGSGFNIDFGTYYHDRSERLYGREP